MDRAKDCILSAQRQVKDKILAGFYIGDIPEIADMIHAIGLIEKFLDNLESIKPRCDSPDCICWILSSIEDELGAAEKYRRRWHETEEEMYKKLAQEELGHALILIHAAMAKEAAATPEEVARLREAEDRYRSILGALG